MRARNPLAAWFAGRWKHSFILVRMGSLGQGLLNFDLDHTDDLPASLMKATLG